MDNLKERWESALEAYQQGEDVKVTDICRAITQAVPEFPHAWYMLALLSIKFNQKVIAKDYLMKAVTHIGNDLKLKQDLAHLFYLIDEHEMAVNLLTSIPDGDKSPEILLSVARSLWKLGHYPNAITAFNEASNLASHTSEFVLPLIKAYLSFGDKFEAQKYCKLGLEAEPENKELYLYYLMFLWDRGLYTQVEERLPLLAEGNSFDMNLFAGFVHTVNGSLLEAEEFFHPLLQDDMYGAKVESFKELFKQVKNTNSVFNTFSTDVLIRSKETAIEGDILEFGVFQGRSVAILASLFPDRKIYGFDSFEGLPAQWTDNAGPGDASTKGKLPSVKLDNVEYIKGWYKDSLPDFFETYQGTAAVVHIDCDLYDSTREVLSNIKPYIIQGTILIFDDFVGFKDYKKHEFKAFNEFAKEHSVKFEIIGYAFLGREVAIRVLEI